MGQGEDTCLTYLSPQQIQAWAWVCPCQKSMPNSLTGGQVPPLTLDTVGLVDRSPGNAGTRSPGAPGLSLPLCLPIQPLIRRSV